MWEIWQAIVQLFEDYEAAGYGGRAQAAGAIAQGTAALFQAMAAIAAIVALFLIYMQIKREGQRHSVDLVLQRRDRYDGEDMKRVRHAVAQAILNGKELPGTMVNDLLGFFEDLGLFTHRRTLEKKQVWNSFGSPIDYYCCLLKERIEKDQKQEPFTAWEEVSYIHREINALNKHRNPVGRYVKLLLWRLRRNTYHGLKADEIKQKSDPKVMDWLSLEIGLATPDTAPQITGIRPCHGSSTRDRTTPIAATVWNFEADLTADDIELFVDGLETPTFSYDQETKRLTCTSPPLRWGHHTVEIVASNSSGLRANKTWDFWVRKLPGLGFCARYSRDHSS